MKAVFVGGGSFRTIPVVRTTLAGAGDIGPIEISLVDLNLARAEAVGRMLQRTPECQAAACRITWTDRLERALPGADFVNASFPVVPWEVEAAGIDASTRRGIWGSDQLSLNGAFRAMRGGQIMRTIVRQMEKACPDAWLTFHANPVAVYSAYANNHTRVKALGLCGSCYHHRWDLTRMLYGADESRNEYTVAAAGINHLTFLLRGQHKGRDLYKILDRRFANPQWPYARRQKQESPLHLSFRLFREMRRRFGYILNANEHDGLVHLFYDEVFACHAQFREPLTPALIRTRARQAAAERTRQDNEFRAHLNRELPPAFWSQPQHALPWFGIIPGDPTAAILRALATGKREWLAASLPNRGVIPGIKDRAVVDYSFTFDRRGVHPDKDLEVPDCFHGLIGALAMHQTLLGDAIATGDPRVFAQALCAYPLYGTRPGAQETVRDLFAIYRKLLPAALLKAQDYL